MPDRNAIPSHAAMPRWSRPDPGTTNTLMPSFKKYQTIVADPPWPQGQTGYYWGDRHAGQQGSRGETRRSGTPYPGLPVPEIHELPVRALAESDAHLYLWVTQKFLAESFAVAESWGFRVQSTLVWCKQPMGFMGGAYRSSTEFIQFAVRGSLAPLKQAPTRWFTWPRSEHSAKPEAFLDLVEQVSPSPYLELFARRQRLGWDTWGDQALKHVEMPA